MSFNKKALSSQDKSALLKKFISNNLSQYSDITGVSDSQLQDVFDFVVNQAKKQWKTGPSSMNSKEWREEIESRFSYYLEGMNTSTTINTKTVQQNPCLLYTSDAADES